MHIYNSFQFMPPWRFYYLQAEEKSIYYLLAFVAFKSFNNPLELM